MELIGNSLDKIADEKAGIIKPQTPCILGPTCLDRQPILDRAKSLNSNLIKV